MTAVARMQLEHQFSLLKLEHAKRIADINQHFRTLRYEARNELADKIAKISKVYHDVININKQQRQSLWVEKCRLESATPVDVDAIADNRAEHNELKRQANVLTTQLDADITALKRNYSSKKAELAADESRQLLSVAEDIAQRRQNLINEIASLVQKGGNQ